MSSIEQDCDRQRIDDYLDERLGNASVIELERHLDGCEACRAMLQQRSAEPEVWREAIAMLSDSDRYSDCGEFDAGRSTTRQHLAMSVLDSLAPTDDPEMLGRIGSYEVSGVVGVGGMGAVLKGFDTALRRVVAIKVMSPHLAGNGSARTRFQREARAAAAITHDNVIDTYGVSEAGNLPYIVMPFARGPSLQKRIDESGPLSAIEVARIGFQIASGLSAAHEQGLVHRDIKPANILLHEGIERLWITDFGVARAIDDATMTQTGLIAGTPQYMSPEQARGETVDTRSDLFSLGSVLYTACTGRPPFRSEAAYGILRRITDTDPRPIREINPDIPDWLCQIIGRLMAKHPSDRFQRAADVARLLENCIAHLQQPTQVDLPSSVASSRFRTSAASQELPDGDAAKRLSIQPKPTRRKPVWLAVLLGLAACLGIGVVGFQMTGPPDISGDWKGEQWNVISLAAVKDASGWYSGSLVDSAGRRGAIQFEWSRMHRRYEGRWRIGDQQSGDVTLRSGGNELRGAASVDSDSRIGDAIPRLRDFSWRRMTQSELESADVPSATNASVRPRVIESPIKGRVLRVGNGIKDNAPVKKGDLIAEIINDDYEYQERLEKQKDDAEDQAEAARVILDAKRSELLAMERSVAAVESQRNAHADMVHQLVAISKDVEAAAAARVDAAKADHKKLTAALEQAKINVARQQELFREKVTSEIKLQRAQSGLSQAEAQVRAAEVYIEAAMSELGSTRNEQVAKQVKAKADLDAADVQLNNTMVEIARIKGELAKAELELKQALRNVEESNTKLARQQTVKVIAPIDGRVTQVAAEGGFVKQGDLICQVWPVEDDAEANVPAVIEGKGAGETGKNAK